MAFLFLFVLISIEAQIQKPETYGWTNVYKTCFNQVEMEKNADKAEIVYQQTNILPFTQLIFSWNAMRPEQGYFTFYAQVRDAQTKEWYDYHKMIDWGSTVQRSHYSRSKGSTFCYARLEIENNKKADGFRIKAIATHQGDLGKLKALVANVSDFTQFQPEPWKEHGKNLNSIFIKGVPQSSQFWIDHPKNDVMCSPTSMSMVVGSLKKEKLDPLTFADYSYDQGLNAFGNWPFNTAHAYEMCDQKIIFYPVRLSAFTDLYRLLKNKIPVVVSVHGPLQDAPRPYKKGHLLVVVGYDAKTQRVLCHDPAFESDDTVFTSYDIHQFIRAWERSRRMTYKPQLFN